MKQPAQLLTEERFIPFLRSDVVNMCLQTNELSDTQKKQFRKFCNLLQALMHFDFHRRLETLKRYYSPFNPNPDTRQIRSFNESEIDEMRHRFEAELISLLNAENFEEVRRNYSHPPMQQQAKRVPASQPVQQR